MTDIIPISDAQAKAIEEALKTLQGVGGFLRETLGTVPADLVGLLGGDFLKVRRAENLSRIIEKARLRLEHARIAHTQPPPLSLALPIFKAAADEDRDELQEVWAGLLAAAADPDRARTFRLKFIEIAKNLDPVDAVVLHSVLAAGGQVNPGARGDARTKLGVGEDEISISVSNLLDLKLLGQPSGQILLFPLGREFLRAIR
jgi:hypothetical protein